MQNLLGPLFLYNLVKFQWIFHIIVLFSDTEFSCLPNLPNYEEICLFGEGFIQNGFALLWNWDLPKTSEHICKTFTLFSAKVFIIILNFCGKSVEKKCNFFQTITWWLSVLLLVTGRQASEQKFQHRTDYYRKKFQTIFEDCEKGN